MNMHDYTQLKGEALERDYYGLISSGSRVPGTYWMLKKYLLKELMTEWVSVSD